MKTKQPEFLELLNVFIQEYMPVTAGLSTNTVRLYKASFRLLLSFIYQEKGISAGNIAFRDLDRATVTDFLDWLESERKCSAATRNVRLAALSSFASYAQDRNADAALVFLAGVEKIPGKKTPESPRIFFTREEVSVLLRMPDQVSDTGRRDAVMLSLMYASGARAQEICDLRVRDVLFEQENAVLTITGKGSKTRRIRIAHACAVMLGQYIAWRRIGQQLDRHIFSSRTHEHMTISCVEAVYKKYLDRARKQEPSMFREKRYSPHTMRHTCAMHMLEAGVSMMAIKNYLGHASVTTTERYAELTQSTVDKHIREWNQRWFNDASNDNGNGGQSDKQNNIPDFLK